jgi:cysteinyl-tRNA synthetase
MKPSKKTTPKKIEVKDIETKEGEKGMSLQKQIIGLICILLIGVGLSLIYTFKSEAPVKAPEPVKKVEKTRTPDVAKISNYNSWGYYLNAINFDSIKKSNLDVIVIDTEKDDKLIDVETIKSLKKKPDNSIRKIFAYVSLGQAENYRPYWKKEWDTKPPAWVGKENRIWKGNFEINNLMNPEWVDICKRTIDMVVAMGYDGILIDGLPINNPKASISFLNDMVTYAKSKNSKLNIFVQDAESFANDKQFLSLVDGVVKQGLIYSKLSDGNKGKLNDDVTVKKSIDNLRILVNNKKHVFVVEFVSGDAYLKAESVIESNQFVSYSAPLKLDVLR